MKIETAFHRQKKHRSFLKAQGIERVRLGYSKKIQQPSQTRVGGGGWVYRGYTFLNPPPPSPPASPLEFLDLSLYALKFRRKQAFTPRNSTKLCDTRRKFQGKNPRLMKIPMLFLHYAWKFSQPCPRPPPA